MNEKKAVTREYQPRYLKASKKEKMALLDEYITLTGYHRKSTEKENVSIPMRPFPASAWSGPSSGSSAEKSCGL